MAQMPPGWKNRIVGQAEVDPSTLMPHPHNWRIHGALQADAMAGILQEVGWVQRILVNQRTGRVIDGHLRLKLALDRQEPLVPILYVDLSDGEEALVLSTIDPLSALAETDKGLLATLLGEVTSGEAGIQQLLAQLAEQEGIVAALDAATPVVDVEPEIDRAEELRQQYGVDVGQLWACGQHRLLCADALEPANVARVLDGASPQMIVADPPYGVNIVATNVPVGGGEAYNIPFGGVKGRRRGHVGGGESYKARHGEYAITRQKRRGTVGAAKPFGSQQQRGSDGAAHVVDVGKYAPIIGDETTDTAITVAISLLETYPAAVHIWWGGNYYADALPASSCWLVWDKETTGNFADCELAWTNQAKAARLFHHRWNGMLRDSERERRWHPTQKPAALLAWVYEICGAEGDVVLDPFVGSGPSVIAAEQRGRRLYGLELSPDYVAVSLHRWGTLTGHSPLLLEG